MLRPGLWDSRDSEHLAPPPARPGPTTDPGWPPRDQLAIFKVKHWAFGPRRRPSAGWRQRGRAGASWCRRGPPHAADDPCSGAAPSARLRTPAAACPAWAVVGWGWGGALLGLQQARAAVAAQAAQPGGGPGAPAGSAGPALGLGTAAVCEAQDSRSLPDATWAAYLTMKLITQASAAPSMSHAGLGHTAA